MKVSIRFALAPGSASDLPIRIRVGYCGMRLDLRSGYVCPPSCWDVSAMRMRPGTANRYHESAAVVNRELSRQESVISELLMRYELDGTVPSPSELKEAFGRKMGRVKATPSSLTLGDLFDIYLSDTDKHLSSGTTCLYESTLRCITAAGLASRTADALAESDITSFVNRQIALGRQNSTINGQIRQIRIMLRYGSRKSLYNGRLHETYSLRLRSGQKKEVFYLTWDEFRLMYDVRLEDPELAEVRDAFCFCCCTGLRVSDCSALRWSNVHLDDPVPHIALVARKTSKSTVVELNRYSREILERRKDGSSPDSLVFMGCLIGTRNARLSVIARMAGITGEVRKLSYSGSCVSEKMVGKCDAITSHWGRHTFIVHALSLGISPTIVMQWTGHASFDSLRPYVAIADTARRNCMAFFDE